MILRKKPYSDEREYEDYLHDRENCEGPLPLMRWSNVRRNMLPSSKFVTFHTQLGREGGRRFSNVRIDVEWNDIVQCIEKFAECGNEQAVQLKTKL
jgi:hypothetical protein